MHRSSLRHLVICIAALACSTFAAAAAAQATRTWVSGIGDDANPCSLTAPCKTFAGAISRTAAGGEISVLDPGGFGALTITKSITINAKGTLGSALAAGTTGIVVNAGVNDVVFIRGVEIAGVGTGIHGINFIAGKALHVEDCDIYGFTGQGINFAPGGTSSLFVTRTSFRNNTGGGIYSIPGPSGTAKITLDNVQLQGNGRGFRAEDGSYATVQGTVASGNTANGFVAMSTSRQAVINLEGSQSSSNGAVGVYSGGALSSVRLSNTSVMNNAMAGLQSATGGSIFSFGNNRVYGNSGGDGAPTGNLPQM